VALCTPRKVSQPFFNGVSADDPGRQAGIHRLPHLAVGVGADAAGSLNMPAWAVISGTTSLADFVQTAASKPYRKRVFAYRDPCPASPYGPHAEEATMALQFVGIDPGTDGNDCPTVWVDDTTGDFVLKGWKITDAAMLAQTAPDPREVVMRIPARMAQFFQEVAGARRGPAV
jgi:hypothetical protein